jgi:acetylornithine deacetylase/succinyl-diaminopimelate desuccinylase-like protein
MKTEALAYAQANRDQALADLIALLSIPSISTLPEYRADVLRGAEWVAGYLSEIGMDAVEIIPTALHPVVYAEAVRDPDRPTLLIYGHYDVQPVDPLEEWRTPPFEPTVIGDDVFARGGSDDKGQFLAALKAAESYLKTGGAPINLKVLIEGEEEIVSPNIGPVIAAHVERLAADAVLICDHPMIAPDLPMILYAVRGDIHLEVAVKGAAGDLHSGTFGGGIDNPFNVLVRMLAQLQDGETRRILIPGFYDHVRDVSSEERAMINGGVVNDGLLQATARVPQVAGEDGYTSAERLSIRPTLEIHGMPGGFTGHGSKTVIPSIARAKLSMRLVPDQDPDEIKRLAMEYLRSLAPATVEVGFSSNGGSYPLVMDYTHPAIQAAERAYVEVYGRKPLFMRGGGSLPITHDFHATLRLPIVMMGLGLPDDNVHAPNEKFHLPNYYRGIETLIHFFDFFKDLPRAL